MSMTQQVKSHLQRWVYFLTASSAILGLASLGAFVYYKQQAKRQP
jgi:hypothetical protein